MRLKLFRRGRHASPQPPAPKPDPAAARAKAESAARLRRDERNVVVPLRKMRNENHVTDLVTRLLRGNYGGAG